MSNQISKDDQVWELTPSELRVAYLSLTLKKREISERISLHQTTVGTHLTNVYQKLGISGYDDEVKRELLKSRFGPTIERIFQEVNGDYVEYGRRRRERQKKISDILEEQPQISEVTEEPQIFRPPPEPTPQPRPQDRRATEPDCFRTILTVLLIFGVIFLILRVVQMIEGPPLQLLTAQPSPIQGPTRTPRPLNTPRPTQTPIPLPFVDTFDRSIDKAWRIIGPDPYIVGSTRQSNKSVLMSDNETLLMVGDRSWDDYFVQVIMVVTGKAGIGVRAQSHNNMLLLQINGGELKWVYNDSGEWIDIQQTFYADYTLWDRLSTIAITVRGNTVLSTIDRNQIAEFTLFGERASNFANGGVVLILSEYTQIESIKINPLLP